MQRSARVVLAVIAVLSLDGLAYAQDVVALEEWRIVVVPHEELTAGPPSGAGEELDDDRDVWALKHMPDGLDGSRFLVFASYRSRVEVWLEAEIVYSVDDPAAEGRRSIHVARLDDPGGRLLSIRLVDVGPGTLIDGPILLTVPDSAPTAIARVATERFRDDIGRISAASVLLVVGFISVFVALFRWKPSERALLIFGLFTAIYGVRLLLESAITPMLGMSQSVRWHAVSGLTYLINVPATLFALEVFGRGWRSSLLWMARAAAVFLVVGLVADLVAGVPFALDRANNVLVIANGLVIVANLARWKALRSTDGYILIAGLAAFGILAFIENLRALFDVFAWSQGIEWVGFILLIIALGLVALRRFLEGEAELIEIGKELAMARSIQTSILPTSSPSSGRLQIRARYIPMTAVAGDFYDYYELPDGKIGVLVADVSGHGVPAAMVASMVKIAASTHAAESSDPAELMASLNRTLCGHLKREFVTVTWMVFDGEASTVRICNAGHPPPLRLTNGSVIPLGGFGILVGKFRNAKYKASTVELEKGDRILCFTDGITEAMNSNGEEYGYPRLEKSLASYRHLDVEGMLDNLVAEVKSWAGKMPQGDDLTLVGIDVTRTQG